MKCKKRAVLIFILFVAGAFPLFSQDIFTEIEKGNLEEVKRLIQNDPQLVHSRAGGIFPLHQAVRSRRIDIAKLLISEGADINKFGKDAEEFAPYEATAVTEAIRYGDMDMIRLFMDSGADLKKITSLGESYLHYAVFMNRREIVKYLIDSGLDVNIKKRGDLTPLHIAALMGFDDIVSLLIDNKADLNAQSTDGATPLHYARAASHERTAELIESRGANEIPRNFTKYSGPYLGIKSPGSKPEVFVPELFRAIYRAHSTPAFSPDGKEVYWECIFMRGSNDASRIWYMREENGVWTPPKIAPFSEHPSGGPAFYQDGKRIVYFSLRPRNGSSKPAKDPDLWYVERKGGEWSSPIHLDSPLNKDGTAEVYPLVAEDGSIYLNRGSQGYVKSACVDGEYREVETIGDLFNTDYIDNCKAMKYILMFSDRGRSERYEYEIYISYHKQDGKWSKPVYLGDKLHPGRRATQAVVTLDGKYLFFASYFYYYWVDAKLIEEIRPEDLSYIP